jgi:hypothetical protein
MKPIQAEKLLGGHATGTLTEAERRLLFAAALEQQEVFDALMDEEALRELLADPAAKAQLIAALASTAIPKVVPFWRRTGVLGAAASLLVASLAGIAYLRSPSALPTVPRPEAREEPAAKAAEAPAAKPVEAPAMKGAEVPGAGRAPVMLQRKAAPEPGKDANLPRQEVMAPSAPAPKPLAMPSAIAAAAQEDSARLKEKADYRRAEVQDQLAKKAEAPRPATVVEVVSTQRNAAPERKRVDQDKAAGGAPGGVIGGVVGGVVSGVAPSSSPAKAKLASGFAANATAAAAPAWILEAQPDGRTRVTVSTSRGRTVVLLRRGAAGVEVLPIQILEDRGQALLQWRVDLRLTAGDALDLYLLNTPVAEPAELPETGPVDGTRVRIHPIAKKGTP